MFKKIIATALIAIATQVSANSVTIMVADISANRYSKSADLLPFLICISGREGA